MRIKRLDKHDQPREKLLLKGHKALSDLELIQLIVGGSVKGADVTKISGDIYDLLAEHGVRVSLERLVKIKGITIATASKLVASLELTTRYVKTGHRIRSIEDVLPMLIDLRTKKQEQVVTITLDGANRVIEKRLIAVGILNASLVHPREVFADAIADRAASIIVAHNHPSGSLEPSKADLDVTNRLKEAGTLLGVQLFDHIIVTQDDEVSIVESVSL